MNFCMYLVSGTDRKQLHGNELPAGCWNCMRGKRAIQPMIIPHCAVSRPPAGQAAEAGKCTHLACKQGNKIPAAAAPAHRPAPARWPGARRAAGRRGARRRCAPCPAYPARPPACGRRAAAASPSRQSYCGSPAAQMRTLALCSLRVSVHHVANARPDEQAYMRLQTISTLLT